MDIAVAGVGVQVVLSDSRDTIVSARIALSAVGPIPLLVETAGAALEGVDVSESSIDKAALLAKDAATPISDMRGTVEHRKQLVYVLTKRALRDAIKRAKGDSLDV
jgi:carbon-monoxide dehydrogenase medium subunit